MRQVSVNISNSQFAGFWIRATALLVDLLIILIPSFMIHSIFLGIIYSSTMLNQELVSMLDATLSVAICWIYFATLQSSSWQATVGKKTLGIKVVDKNGGRISFGTATVRYFGKSLSGIIFCIGYMMAGWTKKKQGLHDMIASTYVVKETR